MNQAIKLLMVLCRQTGMGCFPHQLWKKQTLRLMRKRYMPISFAGLVIALAATLQTVG